MYVPQKLIHLLSNDDKNLRNIFCIEDSKFHAQIYNKFWDFFIIYKYNNVLK